MTSPTSPSPVRFTLRDLSLPSRLVLTVFLIAVGMGYFSALIQLHLQHSSKDGNPLPTPADVVEVFAGLKKANGPPEVPISKLERLIMGPLEGKPFNGSGSMSAAFFHRDEGGEEGYKAQLKDGRPKAELDGEREGERRFVRAWINTKTDVRGDAFRNDLLPIPDELSSQTITPKYLTPGKDGVMIRTILIERCARCHAKGSEQEDYPLETYDQYLKYMDVPLSRPAPPAGWDWSDRQISMEKLTQSTHAHLLSFAVLFMLTGLIFTFTRYPAWIRAILGPLVLAAEVADVSCWWLARLPNSGPIFAMAIIGTGTIGGVGLLLQIFGSLWDMYRTVGRCVLLLLTIVVAAAFIGLITPKIIAALAEERELAVKLKAAENPAKGDNDNER